MSVILPALDFISCGVFLSAYTLLSLDDEFFLSLCTCINKLNYMTPRVSFRSCDCDPGYQRVLYRVRKEECLHFCVGSSLSSELTQEILAYQHAGKKKKKKNRPFLLAQ